MEGRSDLVHNLFRKRKKRIVSQSEKIQTNKGQRIINVHRLERNLNSRFLRYLPDFPLPWVLVETVQEL